MNLIHHDRNFPEELRRELNTTWLGRCFTRRTVVVRDEATREWVLLGCVLHPLAHDTPLPAERYEYDKAVLTLDSIAAADLAVFFSDLGNKLSELVGRAITREFWPGCEQQPVASKNYWMERPGVVFSWKSKDQPNPPLLPLLTPSAPYYPDVHEAARDWLQLREHHAFSDGRKGHVMLLLPETRAFIQDFSWGDDDEHLRLAVAGGAVAAGKVAVKGAYWFGTSIRQLNQPVQGGGATLFIPREADRLELFLMDAAGAVYEHHRESLGLIGEKRFLGSRHRMSSDRIAHALRQGEGAQIEFKEFVDLPKPKEPVKDTAKLKQVLRTIAAFSNAEGGTVFIGVSNDMRVVGIAEGLRRWAQAEVSKEIVDRYAGALRAHLRDEMHLPVNLDVSVFQHQKEFVVLIEVPPSNTLVSVKGDHTLYRRLGASNRSVPPGEWPPRAADFLPFGL